MSEPEITYTVLEFCEREHISITSLYRAWKRGDRPRCYYIGGLRRITEAARLDWHRQLEAKQAGS